jgi:UDP-3-O-[3-hydroxymyristoyl] glucosamine N-acyltransferase
MADPRFSHSTEPIRLGRIAELIPTVLGITCGEFSYGAGPGRKFLDIAPLEHAEPREVSFLDNKRYLPVVETSQAAA